MQFAIYNLQSLLFGCLVSIIVACFAATAQGDVDLPEPNRSDPIAVSADAANRWTSGSYDVWLLKGNCRIQQGAADARCSEALLWIERADGDGRPESKIIAYLEGDVELARNGPAAPAKVKDRTWLGRFTTNSDDPGVCRSGGRRAYCDAADLPACHGAPQSDFGRYGDAERGPPGSVCLSCRSAGGYSGPAGPAPATGTEESASAAGSHIFPQRRALPARMEIAIRGAEICGSA